MIASRYLAGVLAVATVAVWQSPTRAEDGSLTIELNKMEDSADGCLSSFLLDNRTGHQLNRFQLDLVVFDPEGIAAKQATVDMAPLYVDKRTFATILLGDTACDKVGSILINNVPACENGSGHEIGCVDLLEVSSRSDVPLEK